MAKKKNLAKPVPRTMAKLRADGWTVDVVERFIGWGQFGTRKDYLGFADLIACKPGVGILAVSCCGTRSFAPHLAKHRTSPELRVWLASGGRFQIWGWDKKGAAGARKLWTARVEEHTVESLGPLLEKAEVDWRSEELAGMPEEDPWQTKRS
jgi:hypothetical protein